ncbi:MAG: hypothetical protein RLZZ129_668 [Verrucomicrobiota bacterium]|jgi:general secretion pathway protein D
MNPVGKKSWPFLLVLLLGLSLTGWRPLVAQSNTETKIRLMAEALRARDAGDSQTARAHLEELNRLAPGDPVVRRLLEETAGALTAIPAGLNLEIVDVDAEAIAREEGDRLRRLMTAAMDRQQEARQLARDGRRREAAALLAAAVADLPMNPLTQGLIEELRREQAQHEQEVANVHLPVPPAAEPTLARLVERGRSQYLAGDRVAAEASFRQVLDRQPDHQEAARFLARMEAEKARTPGAQRMQTRGQLLAEVDRSWQRPEVFQERLPSAAGAHAGAPLARKLEEIILPNVSFTRMEIGRVVSALSAAAEEFDATTAAPRGVNIVLLDPADKRPTVTLTLRNTNLKRVLDFVTESVGYQYEVQADAVVVRPGGEASALETAFFPVSRATVLRMTGLGGAPAARQVDPFSSAGASNDPPAGSEAQAMRGFLQQAGVNFETVTGSSLAYDGSAIIVTQSARNLERIRNILNRYNDIRQVEIEAKFMEVQEGALEELGISWSAATRAAQQNAGARATYLTSNRSLAAAFTNTVSSQQGRIVRPESITVNSDGEVVVNPELNIPIINNAPQLPGSTYLGVGANALANIMGVIGEFDVNAIVRALAQKQGTDLLSAPKVTVLSGNPATMTVAQELRYPQSFGQTQSQVGTGSASGGGSAGVTITAGTPQEFTTRNVGVELKVTPTVEEDDYSISLDLNPRVTEFDGFVEYGGPSVAVSGSTTVTVPSGFYQPIFSVRDISTKVTIWDGATLIMGGLTREEVKKVNDKVPVLGDLPLLGRMFRAKGESTQKRNLLIFVTANLMSPGGSPKKQSLDNVGPSSLFRDPVIVTPAGIEPRSR